MIDNVGRHNGTQWDYNVPLGLQVIANGEFRPYAEQANDTRVAQVWAGEGIYPALDDPTSGDFAKGYMIALPPSGKSFSNDTVTHRDWRSEEEVSRSFGERLLQFEQDALAIRGLFAAYTEAYESNKEAVKRARSGSAPAKAALEASKQRVELARSRYADALDSVFEYCDWAYDNNSEIYVKTSITEGYFHSDEFPILDKRDHEEVARVLTFGSDEEIAELRRSVEMCGIWCGGHTILDVTRAAGLIASTWPERRSDMADFICGAVLRDCVRTCEVLGNDTARYDKWDEVDTLINDTISWSNDALVALDCAWLMEPKKMPAASIYDTALNFAVCLEGMRREFEQLPPKATERDKQRICDGALGDIRAQVKRHLSSARVLWSDTMPSRLDVAGPVPRARMELLARTVATGDAFSDRRDLDGKLMVNCRRLEGILDVEAAVESYDDLIRFFDIYDKSRIDTYRNMLTKRREGSLGEVRSAIAQSIETKSQDDSEVGYR